MSKTQRKTSPQRVREILDALSLPATREGLLAAHRATRTPEVMNTLLEDGEWKGMADTERVERDILPEVLREHPGLLPLVKRMQERDEGLWDICDLLHWFLEKVDELAGNRPLPSHIGVHVKHFDGKDSRFGFLFWEEGRYLIRIKSVGDLENQPWGKLGDEQLAYPTAWDAAMDGWLVD